MLATLRRWYERHVEARRVATALKAKRKAAGRCVECGDAPEAGDDLCSFCKVRW